MEPVITFVDTSALLAALDIADLQHGPAGHLWRRLLDEDVPLITTSYVLSETYALVQARLGIDAVGALDRNMAPALDVVWVDKVLHRAAVAALLAARRRELSLVDCVSFEAMRRTGITRAFAFDRHFAEQGFEPMA